MKAQRPPVNTQPPPPPPPQRCLGPCPTCGTGQVLMRTYDMTMPRYRELPEPLLAVTGARYVCAAGEHAALDGAPGQALD